MLSSATEERDEKNEKKGQRTTKSKQKRSLHKRINHTNGKSKSLRIDPLRDTRLCLEETRNYCFRVISIFGRPETEEIRPHGGRTHFN